MGSETFEGTQVLLNYIFSVLNFVSIFLLVDIENI